ncbi:MAG TPA: PP2C family protein-serine/threonine phosphatase [Vicinamibacterales bacterium]|nr:PP2C family protein-serine/threonine phosphatase [Vicinamibacterales bacterium]
MRTTTRRINEFFETYTRDFKADDLQRLFTRDTRDAYRFFARHVDFGEAAHLPRHKRFLVQAKLLFLAFTMKLSPARRIVYGAALFFALVGVFNLLRLEVEGARLGHVTVIFPGVVVPAGTGTLLFAFLLMNLLVLLEVADRLSLKNDLEVARDIQQAMLPSGLFTAPGVETVGMSRPANTVGGDFYDILPLGDGRLVVTVGDVSGKGSPAALLMALLLAMLRTLVDETLDPAPLVSRLNVQVSRQTPGSRFITLFYSVFDPATGELTYVNAGHMPPLLLRQDGTIERLTEGGIALGMFEKSTYQAGHARLLPGELMAVYSDGITEAESPAGRPFDEEGLAAALAANRDGRLAEIGAAVVSAVERHTAESKFADDLTILLLRAGAAAPAGV